MDEAKIRLGLVEEINGTLARIETARKRRNNAKSELGTAETELAKLEAEYASLCTRLSKQLPQIAPDAG